MQSVAYPHRSNGLVVVQHTILFGWAAADVSSMRPGATCTQVLECEHCGCCLSVRCVFGTRTRCTSAPCRHRQVCRCICLGNCARCEGTECHLATCSCGLQGLGRCSGLLLGRARPGSMRVSSQGPLRARPVLSMYLAPDCEDDVALQIAVRHMVCWSRFSRLLSPAKLQLLLATGPLLVSCVCLEGCAVMPAVCLWSRGFSTPFVTSAQPCVAA